jgi:hypothetical protein
MDKITRCDNESNIVYNYRVQFIEKYKEDVDLKEKIKYSKILANIKFKKCSYSIHDKLKDYLE